MEYRLYHLVMYNLSPIQKGIQAGHSALEYAEKYTSTEEYRDFIENDKTWIILDGGGSIEMKDNLEWLLDAKIRFSFFVEPDLNDAISAITFLVPEKIYGAEVGLNDYVFYDQTILNQEELEFYRWLKQFHLAR